MIIAEISSSLTTFRRRRQWRIRLIAPNNRILMTSESYVNASDAIATARRVLSPNCGAVIRVVRDNGTTDERVR